MKKDISKFVMNLLKFCVVFIAAAWVLEFVASFLPFARIENSANHYLSILQYIMVGLISFLFGQSSTKE